MEATEVALIHTLVGQNDELRHLYTKHQDYERDLSTLEKIRFPSEADRREINRLKRLKLRGKDRMQSILAVHRG